MPTDMNHDDHTDPGLGPSLNRLALTATVHCLTGCAMGEVLGMVIGTALNWSNSATVVLSGRVEWRHDSPPFETLDALTADGGRRFKKVGATLRPRLGILRIEVGRGKGSARPSFRQVTAELIRRLAAELGENLKAVRAQEDMEEAHQARIAVKRRLSSVRNLLRRPALPPRIFQPLI